MGDIPAADDPDSKPLVHSPSLDEDAARRPMTWLD